MVDSLEPVLNFLDRPTQFIVMRIGNFSTNTAPQLNLPVEPIRIAEDGSLAMFSLVEFVEDFEGDAVDFYLASLPLLGNATLSLDGILTYTPCPNCIGMDTLEVYIIERPFGINTTPLGDTGMLRFEIVDLNDPPEIFFYQVNTSNPETEFDISTSQTVSSFIDANRTSPVVVASVFAYDFDAYNDDLTILVRDGDSGSAGYQIGLDAVNTPESLPANWLSGSLVDSFTGYVTFIAFNLTYLPEDANSIGTDEISVRVRDSRGVFSDTITVSIEVLPSLCENDGVCAGSDSDPDCSDLVARRTGFDGYNCSCLAGFGGQYCEIPLGTPESPSRGTYAIQPSIASIMITFSLTSDTQSALRAYLYCSVMETRALVQCAPPTPRQSAAQTIVENVEQNGIREIPWCSVMVREGGREGGRESEYTPPFLYCNTSQC